MFLPIDPRAQEKWWRAPLKDFKNITPSAKQGSQGKRFFKIVKGCSAEVNFSILGVDFILQVDRKFCPIDAGT